MEGPRGRVGATCRNDCQCWQGYGIDSSREEVKREAMHTCCGASDCGGHSTVTFQLCWESNVSLVKSVLRV